MASTTGVPGAAGIPGAAGGTAPATLVNLRDLGGLPVAGGGWTRRNVLYRGDAPYPGDRDPDDVPTWPPATVIDLRSQGEVARAGYAWRDGTRVRPFPLHDGTVVARLPVDADLTALYTAILDAVPDRVAGAVGLVMQAPGPVFVHCAAGKDRTGIVVAALLLAAAVRPDVVVADYQASARCAPDLQQRWERHDVWDSAVPDSWMQAPAAAIGMVVDRLSAAPGGVRGWLTGHGLDPRLLARWDRRFTASTDTAAPGVGR